MEKPDYQPTVFVVDDDEAVRNSLAEVGQVMGLPVECYASAVEFLAQYDASRPGCLVVDIKMPEMSGLELQEQLVADGMQIPVIIITGHGDISATARAFKRGALDFLEKPCHPRQLAAAIGQAMDLDARRRQKDAQQAEAVALLGQLTSEERAVMEGIVAGNPCRIIASQLDVSLRTVQFRKASLLKKLEVESTAELISIVRAIEPASPDRFQGQAG